MLIWRLGGLLTGFLQLEGEPEGGGREVVVVMVGGGAN